MTPPGNIYIVAERVAVGCHGGKASTSVAESRLEEVLVHEVAHAMEYQLTQGKVPRERFRSEGFATWFELYAAQFSADMSRNKIWERTLKLARRSLEEQPKVFHFRGAGPDYARASMYFVALEKVKGVSSIMSVYKTMKDQQMKFFDALQHRYDWSKEQIEEKANAIITSGLR